MKKQTNSDRCSPAQRESNLRTAISILVTALYKSENRYREFMQIARAIGLTGYASRMENDSKDILIAIERARMHGNGELPGDEIPF